MQAAGKYKFWVISYCINAKKSWVIIWNPREKHEWILHWQNVARDNYLHGIRVYINTRSQRSTIIQFCDIFQSAHKNATPTEQKTTYFFFFSPDANAFGTFIKIIIIQKENKYDKSRVLSKYTKNDDFFAVAFFIYFFVLCSVVGHTYTPICIPKCRQAGSLCWL